MIIFSEKKSSIKDVENKTIERYFSEHIDNGSMIAEDGKNYSQIKNFIKVYACVIILIFVSKKYFKNYSKK